MAQVFLSHLHSDHHADLASLYVNAMFGRKVPLEIWGPSSEKPELGLAASIEGLRQVRAAQLLSLTSPPPFHGVPVQQECLQSLLRHCGTTVQVH
jgi:ribonuclease BN (tRNA processing enzyme)